MCCGCGVVSCRLVERGDNRRRRRRSEGGQVRNKSNFGKSLSSLSPPLVTIAIMSTEAKKGGRGGGGGGGKKESILELAKVRILTGMMC